MLGIQSTSLNRFARWKHLDCTIYIPIFFLLFFSDVWTFSTCGLNRADCVSILSSGCRRQGLNRVFLWANQDSATRFERRFLHRCQLHRCCSDGASQTEPGDEEEGNVGFECVSCMYDGYVCLSFVFTVYSSICGACS